METSFCQPFDCPEDFRMITASLAVAAMATRSRRDGWKCNISTTAPAATRVLYGSQMPYEDVLPYADFAVRLRQHALYRLPEVLETIVKNKNLVIISATCAESRAAYGAVKALMQLHMA
jgi:hypothetical protein